MKTQILILLLQFFSSLKPKGCISISLRLKRANALDSAVVTTITIAPWPSGKSANAPASEQAGAVAVLLITPAVPTPVTKPMLAIATLNFIKIGLRLHRPLTFACGLAASGFTRGLVTNLNIMRECFRLSIFEHNAPSAFKN